MNEQNRHWYEAIALRHSRRKFVPSPVEPEKLETLSALTAELNRSSDACRIALVRSHDGAVFSGIRGGYGIIKGAPSYLAFIGAPEESERDEMLGYIGEAAVLEATHLGLGTCWVSGTFDPAPAGSHKRKALEKLRSGEPQSRWPDWARTAAEVARLAPSALNTASMRRCRCCSVMRPALQRSGRQAGMRVPIVAYCRETR